MTYVARWLPLISHKESSMTRKGALSTVFLSATLVASACSNSPSKSTGSTGGNTQNSGGSASSGGGGGVQTTPVSGGNSLGGQTAPSGGNSAGGQAGRASGGGASGGVVSAGGQAGRASGGVASGGQTGPGAGGVVSAGGQGGSNSSGAGGFIPSTGSSGGYQAPGEAEYSMDPGWKFIKQDASGAQATNFTETGWDPVSTPHTYNDVDSFRGYISHSGGDHGLYQGTAWYRKHFKIPTAYQNNKVIIEFERIRQSASFYINGTAVGTYADGVTPCGIDVTGKVNFGDTENVLAVSVSNGGGGGYYWNANATNPDFGGLVGHVWLHVPGKIYQTYPLFINLATSGVYIYGTNYANITNNTPKGDTGDLTLNVEAEVNNESGSAASATLGVKVIDPADGSTVTTFSGTATSLSATAATVVKASGPLTGAKLWSDLYPNLYTVVTTLTVGGTVVNARSTVTGFRKVEFRGGAGTGGIYVNGRFVYLLGFAQRSTNEWAGPGQAAPDWMHDYTAKMIRDANSNYIRWMHVAPQKVDVQSCDRYGVINSAPAGDKETTNPTDAQWQLRMAVMKPIMIYLRNNPSVFMYEAGNAAVSAAQMKDLQTLRNTWDPNGGRGVGDRTMSDAGGIPYSDYFGTMLGNSGYQDAYRDKGPIVETEDYRDEAMRGVWDMYSPPHVGGFIPGATDTYDLNSENFTTGQVARLNTWLITSTIKNASGGKYSAYASIYFSDADADGREQSSCVARVSGKVDVNRIPKEAYYAFRVAGNTQPDIHIVGHWTYPAGTTKTMYVLANNVSSVDLLVNGKSQGKVTKATNGYQYSFASVAFASGTIQAVGYDASGKQVCEHTLTTAGPAAAVKLTPTFGPNGLQADGADFAMFDVEVVDAKGQRVPTTPGPTTTATNNQPINEPKITFTVTGPGTWRGGVNESMLNSTNNLYLYTECGINRVFIRSQQTAGDITLTADSPGLTSAKVTVTSKAVNVVNGLL
jgi:beta-galactosidase